MLMALGTFAFGMDTLPYSQLQRSMTWRHASSDRIGARPAKQFLGEGDDTVRLSGVVAQEITGDRASLDMLRAIARDGDALPLVSGSGIVFGVFVITAIEETQTYFYPDGTPRRVDFSLTLERTDDAASTAETQ
ncbi:MAG: phage tail protein [Lysobacteraceae bacterium]